MWDGGGEPIDTVHGRNLCHWAQNSHTPSETVLTNTRIYCTYVFECVRVCMFVIVYLLVMYCLVCTCVCLCACDVVIWPCL